MHLMFLFCPIKRLTFLHITIINMEMPGHLVGSRCFFFNRRNIINILITHILYHTDTNLSLLPNFEKQKCIILYINFSDIESKDFSNFITKILP